MHIKSVYEFLHILLYLTRAGSELDIDGSIERIECLLSTLRYVP